MVTTYCTVEDVPLLCQLKDFEGNRAVFGESPPVPTYEEVEVLINIAEDFIQDECKNAWGTRSVGITNALFDIWADYLETSMQLDHPNISLFDTGKGDKLEIWDGTTWKDYITTYTEGRGDDFFVDYNIGKIWFYRNRPASGRNRCRATYRYNGGATVPSAIREACALLVGIRLANTENVSLMWPEGESEEITKDSMIERWERQIAQNLDIYRVSTVPVNLDFVPIY